MAQYSIKDLEKLSGIKAHTLRIWELRYGIITPNRTDTNIRYYDDNDLRSLLNIALLNQHGIKISKISGMTPAEIEKEIVAITETSKDVTGFIEALTIAMIEVNEQKFEKVISNAVLKFGFEKTMIEIIHPFLVRIGVMWQVGSIKPAQEHFISNLIRQKLISAIDGQHVESGNNSPKFLLYLPEGEMHELSLLFLSFFIRARHMHVTYLGQSVPFEDIVSVSQTYEPDYIVSIFTTYPAVNHLAEYIKKLSSGLKKQKIILSGYRTLDFKEKIPTNVIMLKQMQDILSFIQSCQIDAAHKN